MTLPLETSATAIRVGIDNDTDLPFNIDGLCVCESGEWTPGADRNWSYFSFSGDNSDVVRAPAQAPCAVLIDRAKANPVTGARNVPSIVWSDWIDFETTSLSQPQLMFRALVSAPKVILGYTGEFTSLLPGQRQRLSAQCALTGDHVTRPGQPIVEMQPSPYSVVSVVQYRTAQPGTQIVIGGDSHLARPTIFPQLVADQLSQPDAPISVWNTAREARDSNCFWPTLNHAIDAAKPSITVIQGWTANDGMTPSADQAYLLRVSESAERTLALGGIPVIVKGLPRCLFGTSALDSWQACNHQLETLVPGALVFDPLPYIENPAAPGNWFDLFSDDGVHPNHRANMALRDPFTDLIKSVLATR